MWLRPPVRRIKNLYFEFAALPPLLGYVLELTLDLRVANRVQFLKRLIKKRRSRTRALARPREGALRRLSDYPLYPAPEGRVQYTRAATPVVFKLGLECWHTSSDAPTYFQKYIRNTITVCQTVRRTCRW